MVTFLRHGAGHLGLERILNVILQHPAIYRGQLSIVIFNICNIIDCDKQTINVMSDVKCRGA